MASRRIPVNPAFVPPQMRAGRLVQGCLRAAHERRAPRVVDVPLFGPTAIPPVRVEAR